MSTLNKLLIAIVIIGVAVGLYFVVGSTVKPEPVRTAGGVTNYDSLELGNPFAVGGGVLTTNGTNVVGTSTAFIAGTTTPCSIQNPFNATATAVGYLANITTGTTTASIFDVGVATTRYATTTVLFGSTLASGAQGAFGAATSTVVAPNAWLVFKTGAGLSGYQYGGTCSSLFIQR